MHLQHLNTQLSSSSSLPPNHFLSISPNPKPRTTTRRRTSISFSVRASTPNPHSHSLLPRTAIQRIADKLRTLGFSDETHDSPSSSAGEIIVPLPSHLPRRRVGHTFDASWSSPANPVPAPGTGAAFGRLRELKREVRAQKKDLKKIGAGTEERGRVPTLAELTIPAEELRRVRRVGIGERKKMKIGKAGITEGIVNGIHERWRRAEVVKIECEDLCRMNMKRTHDMLEKKTGGLVVWRSGSKIVLYRGTKYVYPYFLIDENSRKDTKSIEDEDQIKTATLSDPVVVPANKTVRSGLIQGVGLQQRVRFELPGEAKITEEADRLLDGLGPRFTDWWGPDPLPVDADLLPPVVHGYRRPFRILPYGVFPKLTNDEMTTLRRLARPIPIHFALSRNRNHQGLASSIVKLWEKSEVAKISIKRGAQNTNSEIMAEELKDLTGGTLLARDKEFITLYRGKDFLPLAVSSAIEERRKSAMRAKNILLEETARNVSVTEPNGIRDSEVKHQSVQRNTSPTEAYVKRTSTKLSMALEKKEKAERILAELEMREMRQQPEIDKEGISSEERYMLRKIGLKMGPFLLLGRRGVFDGTIENMHLHWKYRELVKIISDEKSIDVVQKEARTLEAESGGILVAVERVSKGYAIIVYRGKNYVRPESLRPKTLLNKKAALKRSLEAQRRKSLKLHVLKLGRNIEDLKGQLVKDKETKQTQSLGESSQLIQEELERIEPDEAPTHDPEIESTTSLDEIEEFDDTSSTAGIVSARSMVSDEDDDYDELDEDEDEDDKDENEDEDYEDNEEEDDDDGDGDGDGDDNDDVAFDSSVKSDAIETKSSTMDEEQQKEIPSKPIFLSNKERLLLRQQALRMKYRPVLAVGRSNIITGIARTINAHFKKYPLAIVNIKGRAKGTSIREVVFMLEQATGSVLVSQEPSKVILYRGWGAGETVSDKKRKNKKIAPKNTTRVEENKRDSQPEVSPELLEAIRTECGLQNRLKEDTFP